MEDNKNQDQQQQRFDVSPDVIGGIYSNLAVISHSPTDFVTDFLSMLPGMPRPQVRSRVIMSPENAKRLAMALSDNIKKYESMYGTINLSNNQTPMASAFKLPQGEA